MVGIYAHELSFDKKKTLFTGIYGQMQLVSISSVLYTVVKFKENRVLKTTPKEGLAFKTIRLQYAVNFGLFVCHTMSGGMLFPLSVNGG